MTLSKGGSCRTQAAVRGSQTLVDGLAEAGVGDIVLGVWNFMGKKQWKCHFSLEQFYHETKIGRELTDDEQLERFTNWDVGLNAEILDAYYYTCMIQQEKKSERMRLATNDVFDTQEY